MRLVTFNAGLATGVLPHVDERLPHVIAALTALDADLLFVQEFWLDPHWDALVRASRDRLPHAFRPAAARPSRRGACGRDEVEPLLRCAHQHCAGLTGAALAECVIRRCTAAALTMSPDCVNCVATHPVGTIDEIVGPCVGEGSRSDHRETGSAYAPAGLIAYGGSYGTGLLSRAPLEDVDTLDFPSTVNARGAIYARVGALHVFATHFSPGMLGEQDAQVDALLAWMEEKVPRGAPTVLLGDLNMGASSSLYRRFVRAGFHNPYIDRDGRCTYCSGSFSRGGHGTSGWVIDHVLVRGLDAKSARRVLDEPLSLGRVQTTLSDHCGVAVDV